MTVYQYILIYIKQCLWWFMYSFTFWSWMLSHWQWLDPCSVGWIQSWLTNIRPLSRKLLTSHPAKWTTWLCCECASVHVVLWQYVCHSARMRHRAKKTRNTNKPIYWSKKIAACWRGLFIYWLDREMRSVLGFFTDLLVWGTTYFHFWWCSCRGSSETRRVKLYSEVTILTEN